MAIAAVTGNIDCQIVNYKRNGLVGTNQSVTAQFQIELVQQALHPIPESHGNVVSTSTSTTSLLGNESNLRGLNIGFSRPAATAPHKVGST